MVSVRGFHLTETRSSAVAERLRDALFPSVVNFNSTMPWAQLLVTWASDLPLRTIKCCSVVFGVTLRLLVINTLFSSPVNNKRRRLPATSVTNLPRSCAAVCITLGGRTVDSTRWSQILVGNREFCVPHLYSTSPLERGFPSKYCMEKTGMVWLPVCLFWQNTRTWRTDGQTSHDGIGRAYAWHRVQKWQQRHHGLMTRFWYTLPTQPQRSSQLKISVFSPPRLHLLSKKASQALLLLPMF